MKVGIANNEWQKNQCVHGFSEVTVTIDTEPHLNVSESDGFVKVCVEADHESQITYEVILSTMDDTATGNMA